MLLLFFLFLQYFARQVSENPAPENVISSLSVNANALSKLGCCLFMRATHRQGVVVRCFWGGGLVVQGLQFLHVYLHSWNTTRISKDEQR